ncbi:VOC family protein [Halosimplex marinum]|uniref:VOC family protein n=1 Tax=Halosimplex marinum TaxID=3396620 RepID=UPI003F561818
MLSSLHHFGHLVEDYDRAMTYYCDVLGGTVQESTTVDGAVEVAFVSWPDFRIEVVGRRERGTYLDDLIDELVEPAPYHLAVTVPDIEPTMEALQQDGYSMFDPEPVEGLGPYVRAFVEPDDVPGLPIELIELDE